MIAAKPTGGKIPPSGAVVCYSEGHLSKPSVRHALKTTATLVLLLWTCSAAVCQSAATPVPDLTSPPELGIQKPRITIAKGELPNLGLVPTTSRNPAFKQIPQVWPNFKLKLIPSTWPKFRLIPVDGDAVRAVTIIPR